jgi:hypothetical protein
MVITDDEGVFKGAFATGEGPSKGNESGTRIPPEIEDEEEFVDYEAVWVPSTPHHPEGVYMLQGTAPRVTIELHTGNWFGDTTKDLASGQPQRTNVEGCILVATGFGCNYGQMTVVESKVAYATFVELMQKKPFTLRIYKDSRPSVISK